jgi:ribosomal-protein-alanine N-acetyltransferase
MVRKFQPPDARAVEEILRKSPEAAPWPAGSLEKLSQRGEAAWVIETHGVIAGFLVARAVAEEAEILNLSIDPAKRRAGNASALLQKAILDFLRLRVAKLFLEVRESNAAAIAFYAKHGFLQTGRRPNYYRNPDEAAVLMMRELKG